MDKMDKSKPITIVIFGGTGDLAKKKLFSALLDLHVGGHMPDLCRIIGFSNEKLTNEEYRSFVREAIDKKGHGHEEAVVQNFMENFFFMYGDLFDPESYRKLLAFLGELEDEIKMQHDRLFYLAVSPKLYAPVFEHVAGNNLHIMSQGGWSRLLVEKPFGEDLKTASALDKQLSELYEEKQIFRIDHYLAKEAIQNIIAFRFSNTLFENSWNKDFIDEIRIRLYENKGVEGRGSFYSAVGALRDVGENHMLQMLALIAMEHPGSPSLNGLQEMRARVLSLIKPENKNSISEHAIRGQYNGYKEVDGIEGEGYSTETYFLLKTFIDSPRWEGVPFYLESGKDMSKDLVEIEVHFKRMPLCVFCGDAKPPGNRNTLTLTLQPEEKINMTFWFKKPGLSFELEPKNLSFEYKDEADKIHPDAYVKVLYDCIMGDHTLFASTKEVDAAWSYITNILDNWKELPIYAYEPGEDGPKEKKNLFNKK